MNSEVLGDALNPYQLNYTSSIDLTLELTSGWNWISFNAISDDLSINGVLGELENANFITSQLAGFANYYATESFTGWYGTLSGIDIVNSYQLEMNQPETLNYSGMPVDAGNTPIELNSAWNWISYLPQNFL